MPEEVQEYFVCLKDGTEIGPLPMETIESMRACGEIDDDAQIFDAADRKSVRFNRYLEAVSAEGKSWLECSAEDQSMVEQHLEELFDRKSRWDEVDRRNFTLIASIPGISSYVDALVALRLLKIAESQAANTQTLMSALGVMNQNLATLIQVCKQVASIAAAPRTSIGFSREL